MGHRAGSAVVRIGVDARATEEGFKAHFGRGTGRYASELLTGLKALAGEGLASGFELRALTSADLKPSAAEESFVKHLPFGRMTFESQMLYPRRIRAAGVEAVHFLAHGDAPAIALVPQIITVLDLIPLRFPHLYRANKSNLRFKFARFLEYQAIRAAAGVIAISEATKSDVVNLLGIPEEKVAVTHLAVGPEFRPGPAPAGSGKEEFFNLRHDFNLPEDAPLVLYVGGIDPRKNVSFLLQAFAEVIKHWPGKEKPLLCLAGRHTADDQYPKMMAEIRRLGISQWIRELGFVEDRLLPQLYQCADVVAFPSLYEGFGLPVLEAMACGAPVVAGRNSSIPEVTGACAVLCADGDLADWSRTLLELLGNRILQLEYGLKGRERSGLFSWKRTAEQTLEAYKRFLAPRI